MADRASGRGAQNPAAAPLASTTACADDMARRGACGKGRGGVAARPPVMDDVPPILLVPDPRLRKKARAAAAADAEAVRALVPRMLAAMYAAPGIGLAAPQLGSDLRLVVMDLAREGEPRQPMVLVNPEIVAASRETLTREEGCLSLPGQYADVERPARVRARWETLDGNRRDIEAEGLLAVCLQHEVDHLNGVLFTDHLSPLKRNMLLRRLAKDLKAKGRP